MTGPYGEPSCKQSAKIIDVNRAAMALHGAADNQELPAGLIHTSAPESFGAFRQELVCLSSNLSASLNSWTQ